MFDVLCPVAWAWTAPSTILKVNNGQAQVVGIGTHLSGAVDSALATDLETHPPREKKTPGQQTLAEGAAGLHLHVNSNLWLLFQDVRA